MGYNKCVVLKVYKKVPPQRSLSAGFEHLFLKNIFGSANKAARNRFVAFYLSLFKTGTIPGFLIAAECLWNSMRSMCGGLLHR